MKKRILAWVLLLCMLLTACGPAPATDPSTQPSTGPKPSATQPTSGSLSTDIPVADEPSIQIHYRRNDEAYDEWGFWIWETGGEGDLYEINYMEDFGGVAVYPLSAFGPDALTKGIGIIPRLLASWTKDGNVDRMISFADYVMDENNYYHFYIQQGDIAVYMDKNFSVAPMITEAGFASMEQVLVKTNTPITKASVYEEGTLLCEVVVDEQKNATIDLPTGFQVVLGKNYEVEVTYATTGETSKSGVSFVSLYTTDAFNELYYYEGELGAIYTAEKTTFKVWSPVSSSIVLNIYDKGFGTTDVPVEQVEMTREDKGVFSATLEGDYAGKYYTYTVTNYAHPDGFEVVDPYAKSAGLNGIRGQIVDFSQTNPAGWEEAKE